MPPTRTTGEISREEICPRCGGAAKWQFLDKAKSRVEVSCPDCGAFRLSRRELEEADAGVREA